MREDFSGYLICSDYDETFAHWGKVPEQNLAAVEEYMRRGGLFTFCTGRSWDSAAQGYPILPNAPMVALSGGQIGDVREGKMLEGYPMAPGLLTDLQRLTGEYPTEEMELCFQSHCQTAVRETLPEEAAEPIYKVVLFTAGETVREKDRISALCGGRYSVSFNGPRSIELTARGHDKGTGAQRVKVLTGARVLVGIGDYDADIPLLAVSDIAAAPKGSSIEKCASILTASAEEGALADLIGRL